MTTHTHECGFCGEPATILSEAGTYVDRYCPFCEGVESFEPVSDTEGDE